MNCAPLPHVGSCLLIAGQEESRPVSRDSWNRGLVGAIRYGLPGRLSLFPPPGRFSSQVVSPQFQPLKKREGAALLAL